MKNTKLSPKNRRKALQRVLAGEKQKDIAAEFGVSPAYISQILAQEREKQPAREPKPDVSALSTEHLQNRFRDLKDQETELLTQRHNDQVLVGNFQRDMTSDTARADRVKSETEKQFYQERVSVHRKHITFIESDTQLVFELSKIYSELSEVMTEFRRRGVFFKVI